MASAALVAALMLVESNNRWNAVGDGGRAIGPLQIHQEVVADVNRIRGTRFSHQHMTNTAVAIWVCRSYVDHYATPQRIGRQVTDADRARIWNGGPDGWRQRSTVAYWHRVRREMQ